jgi:hypothetical protein
MRWHVPKAKNGPDRQPDAVNDLPLDYGRSRVVLMPVNPFRVHAYWEVTPDDRSKAEQQLAGHEEAHGDMTWVLRFCDVTGGDSDGSNAHGHFDVSIDPSARNRYVDLWSAEKDYFVELGLQSQSGFVAMCRSRPVHVPRADPSPRQEPKWQADAPSAPQAPAFDPHWATVVADARRPIAPPPPALAGIVGPVVIVTGDDPEARAFQAVTPTEPTRAVAQVVSADAAPTEAPRADTQVVSAGMAPMAPMAPIAPSRAAARVVSAAFESEFGMGLRASHSVSLAGVSSSPGRARLGLSGESIG